jgi:hypothetical protein
MRTRLYALCAIALLLSIVAVAAARADVGSDLSVQQRNDLTAGVQKFVLTGVQNSADKFSKLRGAPTNKERTFFSVNQSFGKVLSHCIVDGSVAAAGIWMLNCSTIPLTSPKDETLELIRAAAASSLPGNFTQQTDAKPLDFLWTRNDYLATVSVWTVTAADGSSIYHIQVAHPPS